MGLAVMIVCGIIAKRRGYPLSERATFAQACKAFLDALPSLLLVFIVMGGILGGILPQLKRQQLPLSTHLFSRCWFTGK